MPVLSSGIAPHGYGTTTAVIIYIFPGTFRCQIYTAQQIIRNSSRRQAACEESTMAS